MTPSKEDCTCQRCQSYRRRMESTHSEECWKWHPDCALAAIAQLRARIAELEKGRPLAELEEALREAEEVLELSDPEGRRAKHIHAPEDPHILRLCEETGFGAVMDSAARQWRNRDPIGAHTTGAAAATVVQTLALIRRALENHPKEPKE